MTNSPKHAWGWGFPEFALEEVKLQFKGRKTAYNVPGEASQAVMASYGGGGEFR